MFFFAVWAGARAPPKQQKNKQTRPRPNSKKHAPAPSERFFLLFGRVGVFIFAVWTVGVIFFCCLGGCVSFLLFGRVRVLFLLFGRGACLFFCCLAGWRFCFFFAVWAEDRSSLTYRSAWLFFKRPSNKKDQTTKKQHGFRSRNEVLHRIILRMSPFKATRRPPRSPWNPRP